jgi:hypothetical protein
MKESTLKQLQDDLQYILDNNLTISEWQDKFNKGKLNISSRMVSYRSDIKNVNNYPEIYNLYMAIKERDNKPKNIEQDDTSWSVDRDENGVIQKYHIYYPTKSGIPFITALTRQDAETLFSLYTYYGGNVTARNVCNEFPQYTLAEIKMIFRCFNLTKDSIFVAPHLLEELTPEQIAQYRMQVKERAAFKYCDAKQERDFTNQIKKMASEINKLKDSKDLAESLIGKVEYEKVSIKKEVPEKGTTGVICLSDLHVGAFNVPEGYIDLPEYNESEVNRRLDYIINQLSYKGWENVIVLNLGDSIDSFRKMTTSMSHQLPCVKTDREIAEMYLSVMKRFFYQLKQIVPNVQYNSIGSGNHSGDTGWLCDMVLVRDLTNELGIKCYLSNKEIDAFNYRGTSYIYLHGKAQATKGQYKGFPLNLNDRTQCWFNDFFADTDLELLDKKVVIKGDLHQFSVNSVSSFDYINCPSVYGSSTYIVSNFGYTKWGCAYLEIDTLGNYNIGVIKE